MIILSVSEAEARLESVIEQVAQSHQPVLISGNGSSAVLASEDDWRALQETVYLLSVPGMRESIVGEMKDSVRDNSVNLDW